VIKQLPGVLLLLFLAWNAKAIPIKQEAQQIGVPFIHHYSKQDYNGGTQNWDFVQGNNHILYVANNQGILKYDGASWNLIPLPNHSVVRCLYKDRDGTVYAGGFNEFGFLAPDSLGLLHYNSLSVNLKGKEGGEFWKIERLKDRIYFQSYQTIVIWEKMSNNWTVLQADQQFGFLFSVNDRLILNDQGSGLAEITDGNIQPIPGGGFFAEKEVWSIIDYRGGFLVTTQNEGSFFFSNGKVEKWESEANEFLLQNRFFSLEESDSYFYWGSILNGLIISDKEGHILQHISRKNGLANNTVLSLFLDIEENLWLGLDNGISQIYVHSSLSELVTIENIGSGYAAARLGNRIYLGTNQGLYWIPDFNQKGSPEENLPRSIPELAGQVWALIRCGKFLIIKAVGTLYPYPARKICWFRGPIQVCRFWN